MTSSTSCQIMAIANQKGGVGKTTTAVNLATALAAVRKKVLLIDLDPQGNASTGLGIEPNDRVHTVYDVLVDELETRKAVVASEVPGLDVLPATVDLSGAEVELTTAMRREFILHDALEAVQDDYDYILIDCPPSLGLLTLNALVASKSVLIPLQCEFYALEGLSHLLKTIEMIRKKLNPELDVHGIVLTMYDRRNNLTEQVEGDVRDCLGSKVFDTVIPRNVRISEAPSHGKPALLYDHKCSGAVAYMMLAKELLKRGRAFIQDNVAAKAEPSLA